LRKCYEGEDLHGSSEMQFSEGKTTGCIANEKSTPPPGLC